ncbi:MAG: PLP-dependent cysteine synthase family protein [Noviherbaspirillum sp.]
MEPSMSHLKRSPTSLESLVTPLIEVMPGILAKFECNNPGGSHKVRAAHQIIHTALDEGKLIPGKSTVIEKTGGGFGFGLIVACAKISVPVELAVGLAFSKSKRISLQAFGATLIGKDMLEAGKSPREVVEWHLDHSGELGKNYFYTDQFHNINSLRAHETQTGPEILKQLKALPQIDEITFVACAGTGASLTGIANCLSDAGYLLKTILVEPAGCNSFSGCFQDHKFEGMAVGVKPPFLDWSLISDIIRVEHQEMTDTQRQFAAMRGYFIGNSSAACLFAARKIMPRKPGSHKILTIFYDHGMWYLH